MKILILLTGEVMMFLISHILATHSISRSQPLLWYLVRIWLMGLWKTWGYKVKSEIHYSHWIPRWKFYKFFCIWFSPMIPNCFVSHSNSTSVSELFHDKHVFFSSLVCICFQLFYSEQLCIIFPFRLIIHIFHILFSFILSSFHIFHLNNALTRCKWIRHFISNSFAFIFCTISLICWYLLLGLFFLLYVIIFDRIFKLFFACAVMTIMTWNNFLRLFI